MADVEHLPCGWQCGNVFPGAHLTLLRQGEAQCKAKYQVVGSASTNTQTQPPSREGDALEHVSQIVSGLRKCAIGIRCPTTGVRSTLLGVHSVCTIGLRKCAIARRVRATATTASTVSVRWMMGQCDEKGEDPPWWSSDDGACRICSIVRLMRRGAICVQDDATRQVLYEVQALWTLQCIAQVRNAHVALYDVTETTTSISRVYWTVNG